ncbi:FK506-binding protein 2B [Blastomyces dermatitidis]
MGVTKTILKAGNGVDKPKTGDDVVIDYTGCLYDPAAADKHYMGDEFDSSKDRGEFKTAIGIGKVIRGICAISVFLSGELFSKHAGSRATPHRKSKFITLATFPADPWALHN